MQSWYAASVAINGAFLDKVFGWAHHTLSAKAWIHGGSPTKGYLSGVEVGPFQSQFHAIAEARGSTGCSCLACSASAWP